MSASFVTFIVAAKDVGLARKIAASIIDGGDGMWVAGLGPAGADTATHYISSGYVPAIFSELSPCTGWERDKGGEWVATDHSPGDVTTVCERAALAGVQCNQADVERIWAQADVSTQEPLTAMGRMKLEMISPDTEG